MSMRTILEVIGAALAAIAIWFASIRHEAVPAAPARQSPALAAIATVEVRPKQVTAYAPGAKAKLRLPSSMVQNDAVVVLDSSKLPESDHTQTVTTVLDVDSGTPSTLVSVDPYPLLQFESHKAVGFSYGMTNGGNWLGLTTFSDDLIQVKAVHFGVNGSIDTNGMVFVGVGASYVW